MTAARTRRVGLLAAAIATLLCSIGVGSASAHYDGSATTRINAQWQVRGILSDEYGWYVSDVRCGSTTWTYAIHFPCSFTRLGSRYIVCYHSLDYDYGEITRYSQYSCQKFY